MNYPLSARVDLGLGCARIPFYLGDSTEIAELESSLRPHPKETAPAGGRLRPCIKSCHELCQVGRNPARPYNSPSRKPFPRQMYRRNRFQNIRLIYRSCLAVQAARPVPSPLQHEKGGGGAALTAKGPRLQNRLS